MRLYKDQNNRVHVLDDAAFEHLLPEGCTAVSDAEAAALLTPAPTAEQLHNIAKRERDEAVSKIVVTTQSGKAFDGDEASQTRMSRAIIAMDDGDVTLWRLADNTEADVAKAELREALRLAGAAQSALWFIP